MVGLEGARRRPRHHVSASCQPGFTHLASLAGMLETDVFLTFGALAAEDAMSRARRVTAMILAISLAIAACALPGVSTSGSAVPSGGGEAIPGTGIALPAAWTETPSPTTAPPTLTPTATPPFGLAWATPVPVDTAFDGWVRL